MSSIAQSLEKMFSLEGKVALVTGASGGIGSVLSKGLAAAGATLALADIDMEKLTTLETEIKGMDRDAGSFILNVLKKDSIKECVDAVLAKFGHIDILFNVAGINKREGVLDVEEDTYDRIMGINLKGTFLMAQEVIPHMIRAGKGGSVINIGSYNATSMLGGCAVYGATKSGVVALTRAMANEWAKHSIRANCICPGHFWTPLTNVLWTDPVRSKYLIDRIAMARPGKPEELVGLSVLLASDAGSYMTGAKYDVDGGCLSGGQPWPYDTKW